MNRKPLTSSNVSSVGWDPSTRVLEVEFHNGRVYQYDSVPEVVYIGLLQAGSPGRFVHNEIRNVYPCRHIA